MTFETNQAASGNGRDGDFGLTPHAFNALCLTSAARHFMQFKTLLLLSFAFTIWPMILKSAQDQRHIVGVDFKLRDGPDHLGSLVLSQQDASITVQIPVENRLQAPLGARETRPSPDVGKLGLQVWLLKSDGTVVPQQSADRGASFIAGAGAENWFVMFHFAKVPRGEITGIVLRKEGKLYSQDIAATDWKLL
jgi:hypothetical protein